MVTQQKLARLNGPREASPIEVKQWFLSGGRKALRHKRSGPEGIAATTRLRLDPHGEGCACCEKQSFINHRLGSGKRRRSCQLNIPNPFEAVRRFPSSRYELRIFSMPLLFPTVQKHRTWRDAASQAGQFAQTSGGNVHRTQGAAAGIQLAHAATQGQRSDLE